MNEELVIKPYNSTYADTIISWTNDEESFYRWSAGVLGTYPIDSNRFNERIKESKSTRLFYPYVVKLNNETIGFFTLRYREEIVNDLRSK